MHQAKVLSLRVGERLEGCDIPSLGTLPTKHIYGTLGLSDGRPLSYGEIIFRRSANHGDEEDEIASATIDSSGPFSLTTLEGQHGWIHVSAMPADYPSNVYQYEIPEPIEFEVGKNNPQLDIVIQLVKQE